MVKVKVSFLYILVLGFLGASATNLNKDMQDVVYKQLYNAIYCDNSAVVEELINEFDIALDKVLCNRFTLLTMACASGKCKVVELLLKLGANPNLYDPIFNSIIRGDEKINTLLLRYGAKIKSEWLTCCPDIAVDPKYVEEIVGKLNS